MNNYLILQESLGKSNQFNLKLEEDAIPMVYPYIADKEGLRDDLIRNKIFIARYWPNVLEWAKAFSFEKRLVDCLIPLPIDQRYREEQMQKISNTFFGY